MTSTVRNIAGFGLIAGGAWVWYRQGFNRVSWPGAGLAAAGVAVLMLL